VASKELMARPAADSVEALADRVRRTQGLAAPEPPPGGALVPNETGWLIDVGTVDRRLRPRLWFWTQALGGAVGMTPIMLADFVFNVHLGLPGSMLLGVGSFLSLFGVARVITRQALRHQLNRAITGDVQNLPPGRLVRLRGVITAQATVPTLFRGVPAVLFRNRIGAADETRGVDFALDVAGQQIRIGARRSLLLDEPSRVREPPACGPVYCDPWANPKLRDRSARLCSSLFTTPPGWFKILPSRRFESSVGPGDEVEVFGILHHEVDPDAGDAFSREVPVGRALRAGARLPLIVRSVARR
jgi:hypothetical protein